MIIPKGTLVKVKGKNASFIGISLDEVDTYKNEWYSFYTMKDWTPAGGQVTWFGKKIHFEWIPGDNIEILKEEK